MWWLQKKRAPFSILHKLLHKSEQVCSGWNKRPLFLKITIYFIHREMGFTPRHSEALNSSNMVSHSFKVIFSWLSRGLIHSIDEAQSLLAEVSKKFPIDNEYVVFSSLLLKSVSLSSRDAYYTMERSYDKFLNADPAYHALFERYGVKYFGLDKKKGGLMGLLEWKWSIFHQYLKRLSFFNHMIS